MSRNSKVFVALATVLVVMGFMVMRSDASGSMSESSQTIAIQNLRARFACMAQTARPLYAQRHDYLSKRSGVPQTYYMGFLNGMRSGVPVGVVVDAGCFQIPPPPG